MEVRWLTAFIDRPTTSFDRSAAFWCSVTGSSLSPMRGEHQEFATLVPHDGDAYLRVQRVGDGAGGSHLDVHVDDPERFAGRAVGAGATEQGRSDGVVVLRSPAGLPWCAVEHHGEAVRPPPRRLDVTGGEHRVDQLCIDIPADRFDDECAFWSHVTGWEQQPSPVRQFRSLVGPPRMPLRLVLQRRDDTTGPARAHLDIASDDVDRLVAAHVALGAAVTAVSDRWTTMSEPAGLRYCVTGRDPRSGRPRAPG